MMFEISGKMFKLLLFMPHSLGLRIPCLCVTKKMESTIEQPWMIKFCGKMEKSLEEINEMIFEAYGDTLP